jgi:RNA methyltransferase, TrmH family
MARRTFITSSSNPRLKNARRLRRFRRRGDAFLVEGYRQVACALESGAAVSELFVAPEIWLGSCEAELVRQVERSGATVLDLSRPAFESISGHIRPDGIAALVRPWPTGLDRLELGADPLVLVAEAVERPGNLGTIVRSACAAGADALVVVDGRTDLFHPETVRGSVGTLFKLPVAQSTTPEATAWLRARQLRVVVAAPDADRPCWRARLDGPTAIVVGNERYGVSRAWLEAADERMAIPMPGPADSLNVAVAAGVVMFEAARQRAEQRRLHAGLSAPGSRNPYSSRLTAEEGGRLYN